MTSLKEKHDRLGLLNLPTVMNGALFFLSCVQSDDSRGVDILFSIFALHIICSRIFPSLCPLCFRKVIIYFPQWLGEYMDKSKGGHDLLLALTFSRCDLFSVVAWPQETGPHPIIRF